MAQFDFITDEQFRASLESDYRELKLCLEAGAWKSVHVLAGSIIEAVLIEHLTISGRSPGASKAPLQIALGEAIDAAVKAGALRGRAADCCKLIKSFRNLIHPGRIIRLQESADENGARVAAAALEMAVEAICLHRRETYGPTAEQIVSKLEKDPSALPILPHLLKEASQVELGRLLTSTIPRRYAEMEALAWGEEGIEARWLEVSMEALESCFREAFLLAREEVKERAMARYMEVLRGEDSGTVRRYETVFHRGSDLEYLQGGERTLLKEHLLSTLGVGTDFSNTQHWLAGLARFLEPAEASKFLETVIGAAIAKRAPDIDDVCDYLANELSPMPDERRKEWSLLIAKLESRLRTRGNSKEADLLEQLGAYIALVFDIECSPDLNT